MVLTGTLREVSEKLAFGVTGYRCPFANFHSDLRLPFPALTPQKVTDPHQRSVTAARI
jgi:hypothetical protein